VFRTPLPNAALWTPPTIGLLSNADIFVNGGWWHDNRILASTGQGLEKEEPRAWEGWWNEKIVELVRLSDKQPDALCILLTGRSEAGFSDIIKKMVASKGLEFDIIGLKPRVSPTNQQFQSTMHFKQLFLTALVETYRHAAEIKIYEDRPKHTKGFRDFFAEYNHRQTSQPTRAVPLVVDVVQVVDTSASLDPVMEVVEVQHMVDQHNQVVMKQPFHQRQPKLHLKKTVFFTSYTIKAADAQKLIQLVDLPKADLKMLGSNILICPRPCPASLLEKVGGMGSRLVWEANAWGCYEDSVWAVRVRPVPSTAKYHVETSVPMVVIAMRKGSRPADAGKITTWHPIPDAQCFVFETMVGEKAILRVEREGQEELDSPANRGPKRKFAGDNDRSPKHMPGGRNEARGFHSGRGAARGRGGNPRGAKHNARGNARGGRGRGFNYRSLDDVDKGQQNGQMDYDDAFPPLGAGSTTQSAWPQGQPGAGADLQNYY
jgi:hypothetical protein